MSLVEGIGRLADTEWANLRQLVESLDQIFFLVAQRHEPRLLRQSRLRADHRLLVRNACTRIRGLGPN